MSILRRLFRDVPDRSALAPLYAAIVAAAREPYWYRQGRVPDTVDGRFDMMAAVLSLVLIRLEEAGAQGRGPAALLTETFIDDMDGQLRELGVGDVVVGKHVGKMMGALGGRLDTYRREIAGPGFDRAIVRNVYRDVEPAPEALAAVAGRLRHIAGSLIRTPVEDLLAGTLPTP